MNGRLAILAGFGALLLAGCGGTAAPKLAAIDRTGSTTGSAGVCHRDLLAWADGVYGGVDGERGELRVAVFDHETAPAPRFGARVEFTVDARDSSSPRRIEAAIDKKLGELDEEVTKLLAQNGPDGSTDLVAMFAGVGDAAHAVHAADLYVCSDGLDNRIQGQLTPDHARAAVDALGDDELPDLDGIEVIFDTSTAAAYADLGATELLAIRVFVTELVERSGGRLVDYGPGAGT